MSEPDGQQAKPFCGIVMPISAIGQYSTQHWLDVKQLLSEAISLAGFTPRLVSDADDVGIIHARIVRNLQDDPIVVCDISGKNPNVMLEAGMRLGLDKAIIFIKDDQTHYNFDTSPIEHLEYPHDLRWNQVNLFKEKLASKIRATVLESKKNGYSPFLKYFGGQRPAQIALPQNLAYKTDIDALKQDIGRTRKTYSIDGPSTLCVTGRKLDDGIADSICKRIAATGVINFASSFINHDHVHYTFPVKTSFPQEFVESVAHDFGVNIKQLRSREHILSADQRNRIGDKLLPFSSQKCDIIWYSSDHDSQWLASDIFDTLQISKWSINSPKEVPWGGLVAGVAIEYPSSMTAQLLPIANALAEALIAEGIKVAVKANPDQERLTDRIRILAGKKQEAS